MHAIGLVEGATDVDVACICSRLGILASSAIPLRDAVAVVMATDRHNPLCCKPISSTTSFFPLDQQDRCTPRRVPSRWRPRPSHPAVRAAGSSAPALDADSDEVVLAAAADAAAGRAVGRGRWRHGYGTGRRRTSVQRAADAMTSVDTAAL